MENSENDVEMQKQIDANPELKSQYDKLLKNNTKTEEFIPKMSREDFLNFDKERLDVATEMEPTLLANRSVLEEHDINKVPLFLPSKYYRSKTGLSLDNPFEPPLNPKPEIKNPMKKPSKVSVNIKPENNTSFHGTSTNTTDSVESEEQNPTQNSTANGPTVGGGMDTTKQSFLSRKLARFKGLGKAILQTLLQPLANLRFWWLSTWPKIRREIFVEDPVVDRVLFPEYAKQSYLKQWLQGSPSLKGSAVDPEVMRKNYYKTLLNEYKKNKYQKPDMK